MQKLTLALPLCLAACASTPDGRPADAAPEPTMDDGNPFFDEWKTPYGAPPFASIDEQHYAPAFDEGMRQQLAEVNAIVANDDAPTFDNTIAAMEHSGALLEKVALVFFNLTASTTSDGLQALKERYAPRLSAHKDAIYLNRGLFERVRKLHSRRSSLGLDSEQGKLLEDYHRRFERAGATVEGPDRDRLMELNERLAVLYTQFAEAIRKENAAYLLVIDSDDKLAGLPKEVRAQAAALAEERGKHGKWAFSLVRSSITPFLTYSQDRDLRRQIYQAYTLRGANGDTNDTREAILEIVRLRAERAALLGFPSHAHYMIAGNMAKTPEAVFELMNQLLVGASKQIEVDRKLLTELAAQEYGRGAKLEAWDWWYFAEKLRKAQYDLSEDELKPYFEVDAVREGAFATAEKLFGIRFREVTAEVPRYHPDVKAFDVSDERGEHVGLLYVDYFPRPSKSGGAWMNNFRNQRKLGANVRPIVVNVGNFPAPTGSEPALLGWDEVTTLFHEFGHALHGLLSDVTYPGVSGTSTKRDYVEFPSQLLENWADSPSVIKTYARHYETGEPIPDELIAKLRNAGTFNQGFGTGEYVAAALLDLEWHTKSLEELEAVTDVQAFDQATMKKIGMPELIAPRYHSTYFQHIFSGDSYSAGYYVYGWAEVLEADAFAAFESKDDVFDPDLASKLKTFIFKAGASGEEMKLYTSFRGRKPTVAPLLKKRGFTAH